LSTTKWQAKGSARTFATQLNFSNVAALLQSTLNEEGAADLGLQAHPFLFSLTLSALADRTEGVRFVGRLATYKYYNMDQGVAQALTTAAKLGGARNSIKWENAGNAE
jgi:hypothetical protein